MEVSSRNPRSGSSLEGPSELRSRRSRSACDRQEPQSMHRKSRQPAGTCSTATDSSNWLAAPRASERPIALKLTPCMRKQQIQCASSTHWVRASTRKSCRMHRHANFLRRNLVHSADQREVVGSELGRVLPQLQLPAAQHRGHNQSRDRLWRGVRDALRQNAHVSRDPSESTTAPRSAV